ncbi:amidohydrolase family protein [Halopelagius longus]|uniref:Amidohydrolase n=1 Tax=Halopelagius longus TaxID=1236180 RepID=A0A1H1GVJ0_9EURY|nr:amidohydrolase family protein [Halopelagius longus]RDI69535.1 amidohydrolase [Halopelagius longus]SDR17214.1 hypothetical protein SAMN05216278_3895 [Halopelagius longus]
MAESTTRRTIKSIEDIDCVVDADFHLSETASDIRPYLEEPWDELLAGSQSGEGYSGGSNIYPNTATFHPGRTSGRIKEHTRHVKSADDVREGIEKLGVDRPVLTPGETQHLTGVHNDQLAVACATAFNEYLLDTYLDEGFTGSMVIAPQHPDKAAEEINRRADESNIISVSIPSAGAFPPLGHKQYYPIYEACEEADLPILLHGTAGSTWINFPQLHQGLCRHMSLHTLAHPVEHMMHVSSLITRGVPVRYPDLDFVFQEAGLGWIPFMMYRLDHEYPEKPEDAPLLEKRPSEYIMDNFYFTSQPVEGVEHPEYIHNTIRAFDGTDNLLFASDYPHHDFDESNELLQTLRPQFTDDEISSIYGGNALDVLRY